MDHHKTNQSISTEKIQRSSLIEDEFITLADIFIFLKRWKTILLGSALTFAFISIAIKVSMPPVYIIDQTIEQESFEILAMDDHEKIQHALGSLFNKSKYTQLFAEEFMKKSEGPNDNFLTSEDRDILISFFEKFRPRTGNFTEKEREDYAINQFSQYIQNRMSSNLIDKKKMESLPFAIYATENNKWRTILRAPAPINTHSFLSTVIRSFNKVVLTYNKDKEDEKQQYSEKLVSKSKLFYENTKKQFIISQSSYQDKRTKLMMDFYNIRSEINKILNRKSTPEAQIPNVINTEISTTNSNNSEGANSVETTLELIESNSLAKDLAAVSETNKLSPTQFQDLIKRSDEILKQRATLKAEMVSIEKNLIAAKESLTKTLISSATPYESAVNSLPGAKDLDQQRSTFDGAREQGKSIISYLVWILAGGIIGLMFGLGLVYSFKPAKKTKEEAGIFVSNI